MQASAFCCGVGYIVSIRKPTYPSLNDDLLCFLPIKQLLHVALDPNLANSDVVSSILTLEFTLGIFFCLKKNHKTLPQLILIDKLWRSQTIENKVCL